MLHRGASSKLPKPTLIYCYLCWLTKPSFESGEFDDSIHTTQGFQSWIKWSVSKCLTPACPASTREKFHRNPRNKKILDFGQSAFECMTKRKPRFELRISLVFPTIKFLNTNFRKIGKSHSFWLPCMVNNNSNYLITWRF